MVNAYYFVFYDHGSYCSISAGTTASGDILSDMDHF